MAVLADRSRQLRQRLVQLASSGDERVVAQGRDLRRGAMGLLAGMEHALDLVVEAEERELTADDLLRERLAPPLVVELHELVRGGKRVVSLRDHVTNVVWG